MSTRPGVRPPAVAGRFYPDDPGELDAMVRAFLAEGAPRSGSSAGPPTATDPLTAADPLTAVGPSTAPAPPIALVAPHAGYVYSGPVAGSAYRLVVPRRGDVGRVVILGPSHFVAFRGLALPESTSFATPLGDQPVDAEGAAALEAHPLVQRWQRAHVQEHSLEVQIPFVQVALGAVPILPVVTGEADAHEIADALERVWDARTLVVVSSDLSHYLPYERARETDARTAASVERLDAAALGPHDACGVVALCGLLEAARRRGLRARCVDLRNSGDTEGSRGRVVGYGAFAFWGPTPAA